jgi:hypothetical protein
MNENWPALPLDGWRETYRSLHMWTQVVGKIRMELSPPLNHFWHVTLYVNARGLTTGPVPYPPGYFEIQFDFLNHELQIETSEGRHAARPLQAEPVAVFYRAVMQMIPELGIECAVDPHPQEVPGAIRFDEDQAPGEYNAEFTRRHWRILISSAKVFDRFRSKFLGKCSPVHFFWGSFDLACTRFSGRLASPRKGVISGPAYSHEESSHGFWPGGGAVSGPAYYAYTVPAPAGIQAAQIRPREAAWNAALGEFVLMYDDVRNADLPEQALYAFIESTYEAGATLGKWDRSALEAPAEK